MATPHRPPAPGSKKASTKKPGKETDLDALLTGSPAPAAELPSADLMKDTSDDVVGKRVMAKPAGGKVLKETVKAEAPLEQKTVDTSPAPVASGAVAPREPEKAPEVAAPDVTFKAPAKRRSGAFQDFLGAIKYFGLGGERLAIVHNLATMLNAGLPLVDSIKTLQAETRQKPVKKLLGRILEAVESGSPLWRAMQDQHFFSPHALALIRIGEEAGNLAENMEYLAIQQEKDQALRSKVKMAMIYPVIVLTLMFIIVIGLGMFVLPNLITVLFSLNVPLPLATRLVIKFTEFFVNYGKTAVPAMVSGFIVLLLLCKFTPLRGPAQWFLFKIPGIGRLTREATIARFGVILGGLLQAGVPLLDAIKSLAEVTPVVAYKHFYERLNERITLGDSFSKSFASIRGSQKILPVSVQQLVVTGEKSGALAKILLKVADIYEKKANATAEKLPVILEPMLLLFIGGLVGTIAFAIIVPIYSIVGNIGN